LITLSEEASKNLLLDRWRMTRVGCMLSCEKIDDASISDPDLNWSNKLNSIAPMISILVILLLAILFSLAWRDQPVPGGQEPARPETTLLRRERRPTPGTAGPSRRELSFGSDSK
jgi:hypothetical protein